MRDLATCFSEYAVQVVSDTTSSCTTITNTSCIIPNSTPSIQNTVTSLYKTILSTNNHILITLTWTKHPNLSSQGLSITFGDDPITAIKLNTNSRLFRKLKGIKSLDYQTHKLEVFWDLSAARYETGPEPLDGFYLFVIVDDSELGFIIGDLAQEAYLKKIKGENCKTAKICSVSRQEHFSGNTVYSTRARFCESGSVHDILIRCSGENEGLKYPVLSVTIDKKTVIRVKRLQWNFRGNQTIFLDGLLVDLMWDVHDWFYNGSGSGYAVFMFRTRSGMDSRLWLEEKMMVQHNNQDKVDFSLLIYACKNHNYYSSS